MRLQPNEERFLSVLSHSWGFRRDSTAEGLLVSLKREWPGFSFRASTIAPHVRITPRPRWTPSPSEKVKFRDFHTTVKRHEMKLLPYALAIYCEKHLPKGEHLEFVRRAAACFPNSTVEATHACS